MTLPTTQRAIFQPDPLSTAVIKTTLPVPTPDFAAHEHLIRVHATAITNGELLWTKNFPPPPELTVNKQLVPCNDVAGTVISAPPSSPFPPGSEVYARSSYMRTGCARDYSILLTEEMAIRPKVLDWAQAAAVPMSAETAWQALFVQGGLKPEAGAAKGQKVFITAASGGVGTWLVQLAKWAGAEVAGSCGTDNVDWVRSLGADEVVDYKTEDLKQWATVEGRKADLVIDCIGRKSLEDAWWIVKDGGTLISIFQAPEDVRPPEITAEIKNFFFIMQSRGDQLKEITRLIENGMDKVALDSVWPFEQFQDAFSKVKSGKTKGKVVLDLTV